MLRASKEVFIAVLRAHFIFPKAWHDVSNPGEWNGHFDVIDEGANELSVLKMNYDGNGGLAEELWKTKIIDVLN